MSDEMDLETVDGQVFIEVDDNEMSAKMTVLPPQDDKGRAMSIDDIKTALKRSGVTSGILEDKLEEIKPQLEVMAEDKLMADPVEVDIAEGLPMVAGEDAHLQILFRKEEEQELEEVEKEEKADEAVEKKKIGQDKVDFHAGKDIENVPEGTAIARIIPAKEGVAGMTIKGTEIPTTEGAKIEFKAGEGVKMDEKEPEVFIAEISGQVIIKDNQVSVKSVFEVKGDVDFSTGSIDFVGTVIIQGNVKDDFKVKAGEDLIINGVVEAAEIECGRNLTIAGGMMGHDKGTVYCKGDANVKYLRNVAKCVVDGDLTANQSIMYSHVVVKNKVNLTGSKGTIIGGKVVAGISVLSNTIGNHMATATDIQVGALPGVSEELELTEKNLVHKADELDKSKKGVVFLKNMQAKQGALPPAKKELLAKLTRAQFQLMGEIKNLNGRKQELEKEIETQAAEAEKGESKALAKVSVTGLVYSGVRIKIHEANRAITEELKYCTLTEKEGEVQVGAFSG